MEQQTTAIWEFPHDATCDEMGTIAMDVIEEPDARGVLLSNLGDVTTMQITEGKLSYAPDAKLYVEKRGAFTILRRESWPAVVPGGSPRVVVTAQAWPIRG